MTSINQAPVRVATIHPICSCLGISSRRLQGDQFDRPFADPRDRGPLDRHPGSPRYAGVRHASLVDLVGFTIDPECRGVPPRTSR